MLLEQIINGLTMGSIYTLTALGATMVYGIMRILDVNNAGAYVIGAYLGYFFYSSTNSIILSLFLAALLTGLFGVVIQKLIYLPMLGQSPNIALIASIGLFICVEDIVRMVAGARLIGFHVRFPLSNIDILNFRISFVWLVILITTVVLLTFLWLVSNKTKMGLAWKAASQDIETAQAMGVNTNVVIGFNYLLGYGFAAIAGVLVAVLYSSLFPHMGAVPAYKMLSIIVLGGLGSPIGAVIAAMTIGMVETLVGGYIGFFLPRDAIAFIALIIILLIRPTGLVKQRS